MALARRFGPLVLIGSALAFAACKEEELAAPVAPPPPPPAPVADHLIVVDGDGQTGAVGTVLPIELTVRVVDKDGGAMMDVPLSFTVATGGGSVPAGPISSGAEGLASRALTLATLPGAHTVIVAREGSPLPDAAGSGHATLTFRATAVVGAPDHLILVDGDGQTASVGATLPADPTVRVVDRYQNAVPGVGLSFLVTAGGGSVDATQVDSDAEGLAASELTLGTAPGANTLRVERDGAALPDVAATGRASVTFHETAITGPADHLILITGDGQAAEVATLLAIEPTVRVVDRYANPVAGVSITFTAGVGGGTAGSPLVTSGDGSSAGLARTAYTLGSAAGAQTLVAAREGTPLPALAPASQASITFQFTARALRAWSTVDDFVYSLGDDAYAEGVAVAPNGHVFTAGSAREGYDESWTVRRSTDLGATWTTIDTFGLNAGGGFTEAYARDVTTDAAGNVYVVGYAYEYLDSNYNGYRWVVRKSTDDGASWTTRESYWPTYSNGGSGFEWSTDARAFEVAAGAGGNVFVAGMETDPIDFNDRWVVRHSGDGGSTWQQIYRDLGYGYSYYGIGIEAGTDAAVYLAHTSLDGAGHKLYAYRGTDGSSGWEWELISDQTDLRYANDNYGFYAQGLALGPSNAVYVVGAYYYSVREGWAIRRGTRGSSGWNWTQIGGGTQGGEPYDAVWTHGALYVGGEDRIPNNFGTHWTVRRYSWPGGVWQWNDFRTQYQLDENTHLYGLAADATGRVYGAGWGSTRATWNGMEGDDHWLVERTDDANSSWSVLDDHRPLLGRYDTCATAFGSEGSDLYVAGWAEAPAEEAVGSLVDTLPRHWVVRKSTDGGATWATIDSFQQFIDSGGLYGYTSTEPLSVAGDGLGTIFVAGLSEVDGLLYANDGLNAWWRDLDYIGGGKGLAVAAGAAGRIYFAGLDQTGAWVTRAGSWDDSLSEVDAYSDVGGSAVPVAVAVAGGAVYVAGNRKDGANDTWFARKSTNNGESWTSLTQFGLAGGTSYKLYALRAEGTALYATGYAVGPGDTGWRWLVKKSLDGGATWSKLDEFQGTGSADSVARGVVIDAGSLYVAGTVGFQKWLVRRSDDGGVNWTQSDTFNLADSAESSLSALGTAGGSTYQVGCADESSGGTSHWVVRKR